MRKVKLRMNELEKYNIIKNLVDNNGNKNIIEIVNDMVKNEDYDGLNLIFSMEILERESCMSCIDTARENSHMEGLGQLLAYQKKHFAPSHRKFEF